MMNKNILVFHPALAPYRIDFFNQLSKCFATSFYFSLDNLKDQKFDQAKLRKEINFEFNLLNRGFEFNNKSIRFGIYKIIREKKPDIIICSEYSQITISVLVFKFLFNQQFKIFIISDDSNDLSIHRKGIRKWIRNISSNLIDGIILPSRDVCNWYNKNVNSNTKTLELPIIHSNINFRNKLLNTLFLSEKFISNYNLNDKKVFLFVGRLVKIKNVDFLIKSFAKIRKNNEILIIIGEGEERTRLEFLIQKFNLNETCKLIGRLEGNELLAWYNVAQCFILPSYQEPYGAVVNEALLSGCKVLCSNLAGASKLINKKNGYKFNPKQEIQLKKLIEKISKELKPIKSPIYLKDDLMPYTLENKLEFLFKKL